MKETSILSEKEPQTENKQPLSNMLSENERSLKQYFGNSDDFGSRRISMGTNVIDAVVFFFEGLVDKTAIDQFVVHELQRMTSESPVSPSSGVQDAGISTHKLVTKDTLEDVAEELLTGNTAVFVEGRGQAWIAATGGGERRSVSESATEVIVRGPRESFNESLQTNVGLVRKRLYTHKLRVEKRKIGKLSNTPVALLYLEGIAKEDIVQEARNRLSKIDIDGVLESQYIEEFIEDPYYSPFPTVYSTERPDRVAAALLEGRIGILTDGTPVALVVPATISMFLYSNEDYYQRFDIASLLKLLRTFTFFASFLLPSFYVALLTFHQEMIPTPLLIALTGQREGVPFGIAIEVFLMEVTFEILREAGIRLPKSIGSAVSIVGGLVLGQAAVEASLVGAGTVIAVSATAIASFTTPSYSIAIASRMIRFGMLILSAFLGAFGFFFGLILLVVHLNKLRSFGVPYLSPIVPFHKKSWRDLFIRVPFWAMRHRPDEVSANKGRFDKPQKWNNPRGGVR